MKDHVCENGGRHRVHTVIPTLRRLNSRPAWDTQHKPIVKGAGMLQHLRFDRKGFKKQEVGRIGVLLGFFVVVLFCFLIEWFNLGLLGKCSTTKLCM